MTINQPNPIKRNACGSIDTAYYAEVAREVRSGSAVGLFARLFEVMGGRSRQQKVVVELQQAPAFKRGRQGSDVERRQQHHGNAARKSVAA